MVELLSFVGALIAEAAISLAGYARDRARRLYFWLSGGAILCCLAALAAWAGKT
ncbi:hypothetical protein ACKI2N_029320 [Cupriavidus sp. 30B13]|uniref:hypothetical protein n=1 Tax=Cupriavidus sp. 30B13 TaxID=3384241 RepID=UPI003B92000C